MFTKTLLERYADVMIWGLETARKSTGGECKKGDIVLINYDLDALKLTEALYRKLLEKGIRVVARMAGTPKMEFDFFDVANNDQLKFISPGTRELYRHLNGSIWLWAPASLTHLAKVNPEKLSISAKSRKPRRILDQREQSGEFGWTLCVMPTKALAKQAKMSVQEYGQEIIRACYLDKDNPVEIWEKLRQEAAAIKNWLNSLDIDYLRIESGNTDLKVTLGEKRKWLGFDGKNIPSFEIFTSPDWRGVEGIYYANMPAFQSGNYVRGIKLVFKNGEAVEINAEEGESFTQKQLAMDGGARRLGEVSLTDKRFSPITKFMANGLFDENVGGENGNCHIAVGASFSDTYSGDLKELTKELEKSLGFNKSAQHWDMINTERKRVTAHLKSGGQIIIYEDGMFKN